MAKFIVNRVGGVHSIPDDAPGPRGCRPATDEEIAAWYEGQGLPVPSEEHGEEKPKRQRRKKKDGQDEQSGAQDSDTDDDDSDEEESGE